MLELALASTVLAKTPELALTTTIVIQTTKLMLASTVIAQTPELALATTGQKSPSLVNITVLFTFVLLTFNCKFVLIYE